MPEGVFKVSGSGGRTSILILEKNKEVGKLGDYKIFVDCAKKVGFDHKKKKGPILYKREESTGDFLFNKQNDRVIENDLLNIPQNEIL